MGYKPYYTGGWKSGEAGGTPITPEALNHMDAGIANADAGNTAAIEYAKKVGALYNLLDNSDFRNPVNQRNAGGTYGAWGGLTIDRWFASSAGATISLVDGGLQLKGSLGHNVSEGDKFSGKKLTLAAKANGEVYCCSGTVSYIGEWKRITSIARNDVFLDLTTGWHTTDNRNTLNVTISTLNDQSIVFEWVALYEGEYTAETLPEYQPKGYGAELAECRRYFRKYDSWDGLCTGYIDWQHHLLIFIPTDIPMRVNPTCSNIAGSIVVNGTYITLDTTPTAVQKNGLIGLSLPELEFAAEHGAQPATIVLGGNGLTLSADL